MRGLARNFTIVKSVYIFYKLEFFMSLICFTDFNKNTSEFSEIFYIIYCIKLNILHPYYIYFKDLIYFWTSHYLIPKITFSGRGFNKNTTVFCKKKIHIQFYS